MTTSDRDDLAAAPAGGPATGRGRALRYQHVYDLVVAMIDEQGLSEGDKLPSTAELAKLADVSVISVRRALDELSHAGIIVRHQGVGTFVAPRRMVSQPARSGALLDTITGEYEHEAFQTELLSLTVGVPSRNHLDALGLDEGQPVWEISRVRRLAGEAKVVEKATIPLSLVPALEQDRLGAGASLYEYLEEKYGLTDAFVEQFFQVDQPSRWEQEHLGVSEQESVVRVRGVSFSADEVPYDSYQQTYRAKDFLFYVSGSQAPRLIEPSDSGRWSVKALGAP